MKMWIKEWFYNKEQDKALQYNMLFDIAEREEDITRLPKIVDGCISIVVEEVLDESDKAVKVRISTGEIDGSYKGWTTWIPKSVINEDIKEEENAEMLEKITSAIENEAMRTGKMGTEMVTVKMVLTDAEKEQFINEVSDQLDEHYDWQFKGNTLYVDYTEEI